MKDQASSRCLRFLFGFVDEGEADSLKVNLHGELRKSEAKKLAIALAYFAQTGRLPDPTVLDRIRNHPRITEADRKAVEDGGREFLICHYCEDLHLWRRENCEKCGHRFLPLSESNPQVLDKVLADMDKLHQEQLVREELERRYPLPKERQDHTYVCQSCRNKFTRPEWPDSAEGRVACSQPCLFALTGRAMPQGRKWTGFLTLWPTFKGGVVLYLGTATVHGKKCECYLWKIKPECDGELYAYYGDGKKKDLCHHWRFGASANSDEERRINENGEKAVDESWRILANIKDSYSWSENL